MRGHLREVRDGEAPPDVQKLLEDCINIDVSAAHSRVAAQSCSPVHAHVACCSAARPTRAVVLGPSAEVAVLRSSGCASTTFRWRSGRMQRRSSSDYRHRRPGLPQPAPSPLAQQRLRLCGQWQLARCHLSRSSTSHSVQTVAAAQQAVKVLRRKAAMVRAAQPTCLQQRRTRRGWCSRRACRQQWGAAPASGNQPLAAEPCSRGCKRGPQAVAAELHPALLFCNFKFCIFNEPQRLSVNDPALCSCVFLRDVAA